MSDIKNRKKLGIFGRNISTRNEMLSLNAGKYPQYEGTFEPAIGELYQIDYNKKGDFISSKYGLLKYTHDNKTELSKNINNTYFNGYYSDGIKNSSKIVYNISSLTQNEINSWKGNYNDYEEYVYELFGDDTESIQFKDNLIKDSFLPKNFELHNVAVIRDFNISNSMKGTANINPNTNSSGDTRIGLIANQMYSNLLYQGSVFNESRGRSKLNTFGGYITPSMYYVYGNKFGDNLNKVIDIILDDATGRVNDDYALDVKIIHNYAESEFTDNGGRLYLDDLLKKAKQYTTGKGSTRNIYYPYSGSSDTKRYINFTQNDTGEKLSTLEEESFDGYKQTTVKVSNTNVDYESSKEYFIYNDSDNIDSSDIASETDDWQTFTQNLTSGSNNNLLAKTKKFFKDKKIETMIGKFHDKVDASNTVIDTAIHTTYGRSHGRNLISKEPGKNASINGFDNPYCRTWTYHHQYNKVKRLIRPFIKDESPLGITELQKTQNQQHRALIKGSTITGWDYLGDNTVLRNNGYVNITPSNSTGNKTDIKKCMFSIENLAWKDVNKKIANNISQEQTGPNGGRIMWFPPYNLQFNESVSVGWNGNQFIGRGEQVYTYTNTERKGSLTFDILIDHPGVIDRLSNGSNSNNSDGDILRYFAGCETLEINDDPYKTPNVADGGNDSTSPLNGDGSTISNQYDGTDIEGDSGTTKIAVIYMFFPNNFTGKDFFHKPSIQDTENGEKNPGNFTEYITHGYNKVYNNDFIQNRHDYGKGYEIWSKDFFKMGLSQSSSKFEDGYAKNSPTTSSKLLYLIDSGITETLSKKANNVDCKSYGFNTSICNFGNVESISGNTYTFNQLLVTFRKSNNLDARGNNSDIWGVRDYQISASTAYEEKFDSKLLTLEQFQTQNQNLLNLFKNYKDFISIEFEGGHSGEGYTERNGKLAHNRAVTFYNLLEYISGGKVWNNGTCEHKLWSGDIYGSSGFTYIDYDDTKDKQTKESTKGEGQHHNNYDINDKESKFNRYAKMTITYKAGDARSDIFSSKNRKDNSKQILTSYTLYNFSIADIEETDEDNYIVFNTDSKLIFEYKGKEKNIYNDVKVNSGDRIAKCIILMFRREVGNFYNSGTFSMSNSYNIIFCKGKLKWDSDNYNVEDKNLIPLLNYYLSNNSLYKETVSSYTTNTQESYDGGSLYLIYTYYLKNNEDGRLVAKKSINDVPANIISKRKTYFSGWADNGIEYLKSAYDAYSGLSVDFALTNYTTEVDSLVSALTTSGISNCSEIIKKCVSMYYTNPFFETRTKNMALQKLGDDYVYNSSDITNGEEFAIKNLLCPLLNDNYNSSNSSNYFPYAFYKIFIMLHGTEYEGDTFNYARSLFEKKYPFDNSNNESSSVGKDIQSNIVDKISAFISKNIEYEQGLVYLLMSLYVKYGKQTTNTQICEIVMLYISAISEAQDSNPVNIAYLIQSKYLDNEKLSNVFASSGTGNIVATSATINDVNINGNEFNELTGLINEYNAMYNGGVTGSTNGNTSGSTSGNTSGGTDNTPGYTIDEEDMSKYPYADSIKNSEGKRSNVNNRYETEADYFNKLEVNDPLVWRKIRDKYKYFDPAFHSINPEGFNARLTFLQQCTRQGHTIASSDGKFAQTAGNLAFGRMPVCVLRLGDFINTRMIIDSMSINYDMGGGMSWDLNPDGAGVQPMYASINLGITLLGGQSLEGPISRLQNAVSFNYYANTGVYDNRADHIAYCGETDDFGTPKIAYTNLWTPDGNQVLPQEIYEYYNNETEITTQEEESANIAKNSSGGGSSSSSSSSSPAVDNKKDKVKKKDKKTKEDNTKKGDTVVTPKPTEDSNDTTVTIWVNTITIDAWNTGTNANVDIKDNSKFYVKIEGQNVAGHIGKNTKENQFELKKRIDTGQNTDYILFKIRYVLWMSNNRDKTQKQQDVIDTFVVDCSRATEQLDHSFMFETSHYITISYSKVTFSSKIKSTIYFHGSFSGRNNIYWINFYIEDIGKKYTITGTKKLTQNDYKLFKASISRGNIKYH